MNSEGRNPKLLFVWVGVLVAALALGVFLFSAITDDAAPVPEISSPVAREVQRPPDPNASPQLSPPKRVDTPDAGGSRSDSKQDLLRDAQEALETYRKSTQYPPHSRPAKEHPDTMRFEPLVQEEPLSGVGESAHSLKLSQDRNSAVGNQSITFQVKASNGAGCQIKNSWLSSLSSKHPTPAVPVTFREQEPQQTWVVELVPTALIAGDSGIARLTVQTACAARSVDLTADVFFNREPPAAFVLPVTDQTVDGSLFFLLAVEVTVPGRYLFTARLDDSQMQGFAYLQSDSVLPVGKSTVKFEVFGKLITDGHPRFPLKLRDIEGFLLREDQVPDRLFMQPLLGYQHASASYDVSRFSNVEWQSEQRTRYLNRLGQQVERAQRAADLNLQNR